MLEHEKFLQWQKVIVELAGLYILPEKAYLFETRLKPLVLKNGLDMDRLLAEIQADENSPLIPLVVDLMTTHETDFFRDKGPFELFRKLVQDLAVKRRGGPERPITVLSAGCSSGEEPYSIAIVLDQVLRAHPSLQFQIHAYDIAGPTLERACAGYYQGLEKSLDATLLETYFLPDGKGWRVKDSLRERVRFEQRNLLHLEASNGIFDFVFCRNVAIYFHPEARTRLYDQLLTHLKPDGILIVGASESLSGYRKLKRYEGPGGFYYKTS